MVKHGSQTIPSNAGIILFANEEARFHQFADARVSCARFAGTEKVDFIDRLDIDGGLLTAIDEVPKFIRRNTRMAAEIKAIRRRDIPEYPVLAVREALLNALLHSDYSTQGSRILVAIFADRMDITNPGMLPLGTTLEDFKNGVSNVRNKVIAKVFGKMELIEQWGSGYKRIMDICTNEGYPEPNWEEFGSAVRVTFYPHPATKEVGTKSGPSRDQAGTKSGPSRQPELTDKEKILTFCRIPRSIVEIMDLLGWKHRTKFKHKFIKPLIEQERLKMTIPDKPQSSKQKYITVNNSE
jgi:ATP-dependent DNA helicase RecG